MSKSQVNFKEILKDFNKIFSIINEIEEEPPTENKKKNILKKVNKIKENLENKYKNLDTQK
jgi:hypothetical protein